VYPTALAFLLEHVLEEEGIEDGAGVTLLLAGDELLQELNREHRGTDEPTDVLSFPASEGEAFPAEPGQGRYLGDIAVSLPMVRRQVETAWILPGDELQHVVLHGLLHLLGYDHETPEDDARMRAREERVLGPEIHMSKPGYTHTD
jgi:probable rRNA maturation factor